MFSVTLNMWLRKNTGNANFVLFNQLIVFNITGKFYTHYRVCTCFFFGCLFLFMLFTCPIFTYFFPAFIIVNSIKFYVRVQTPTIQLEEGKCIVVSKASNKEFKLLNIFKKKAE